MVFIKCYHDSKSSLTILSGKYLMEKCRSEHYLRISFKFFIKKWILNFKVIVKSIIDPDNTLEELWSINGLSAMMGLEIHFRLLRLPRAERCLCSRTYEVDNQLCGPLISRSRAHNVLISTPAYVGKGRIVTILIPEMGLWTMKRISYNIMSADLAGHLTNVESGRDSCDSFWEWYHRWRLGSQLPVSSGQCMFIKRMSYTKWCKKPEIWLKPKHMGTHLIVLSESYPMNTNIIGFRWFPKSLLPCTLGESSPALERWRECPITSCLLIWQDTWLM